MILATVSDYKMKRLSKSAKLSDVREKANELGEVLMTAFCSTIQNRFITII